MNSQLVSERDKYSKTIQKKIKNKIKYMYTKTKHKYSNGAFFVLFC